MYVRDFCNRLVNILKSKGYEINNENRLKNEVATIYIIHQTTIFND